MTRTKWQVPLAGGDEQDYLTGFHHWLALGRSKREGRRFAKRKYQRRARQNSRTALRLKLKELTDE